MKALIKSHASSLLLNHHIQPPADQPPYPQRVYIAYPEVGREIMTGEELDDDAEDELAVA